MRNRESDKVLKREREREREREMKYLEIEGASEQGGLRLRGSAVGHWAARRGEED